MSRSPLGLSYSVLRREEVVLSTMKEAVNFESWKAKGQENELGFLFSPPIEQQGICTGTCIMVILTPERQTFMV